MKWPAVDDFFLFLLFLASSRTLRPCVENVDFTTASLSHLKGKINRPAWKAAIKPWHVMLFSLFPQFSRTRIFSMACAR
jgi:hypothetical protein